jgi:hypothetical protein
MRAERLNGKQVCARGQWAFSCSPSRLDSRRSRPRPSLVNADLRCVAQTHCAHDLKSCSGRPETATARALPSLRRLILCIPPRESRRNLPHGVSSHSRAPGKLPSPEGGHWARGNLLPTKSISPRKDRDRTRPPPPPHRSGVDETHAAQLARHLAGLRRLRRFTPTRSPRSVLLCLRTRAPSKLPR